MTLMTNEIQQLKQLVTCNKSDPALLSKLQKHIKHMQSKAQQKIAIRHSLNITPANAHAIDTKLALLSSEVEQLQLVTASTLSASQLFTVFKYVKQHGFEQIATVASEQNLTFFQRQKRDETT